MSRQIVLDTETTGLLVADGHRIIEVGCVELVNRRATGNTFHHFVNPDRDIDFGAADVHGIRREDLADKPRFAEIAQAFVDFVRDAEVLIHNAEFDTGFVNDELVRAGRSERLESVCKVVDTLLMARTLHPGQKNGLTALCKRYGVDDSNRNLHGALLDARLLADVYVAMTTGQSTLMLPPAERAVTYIEAEEDVAAAARPLPVIRADDDEWAAHCARLAAIAKKAGAVLWAADLGGQVHAQPVV